jgi:hypothetical protein
MIALDDWTNRTTTPDQQRIEDILPWYLTPQSKVLHIGVGNSSLATRFHAGVKRIDGITTSEKEAVFAPEYDNYNVWLCNKYSRSFVLSDCYDVIVDNNPAGYVCCQIHLLDYFHNVFSILSASGVYLTDMIGLTWAKPPSEPITFAEFNELIELYDMKSGMVTESVVEVRRGH